MRTFVLAVLTFVVWASIWGPGSGPYRRYRLRRTLAFTGRLAHQITVPPGPGGRPGQQLVAPSRSRHVGVLSEDGSRSDCAVLIGPAGSALLVVCLERVEDMGTPRQSAMHTISAIDSGAGKLQRMEIDIIAGRPAERYMIALNSGARLLEWKFEYSGWLYAVGAVLHPKDQAEDVETLGRAVLATWRWLDGPQTVA